MQYLYKPGAQIKTPAEIAGQVCQQLEESGGLTAKRLLDASRPVDAPLHDEFEWNDSEAAEKYREHQAAHIIRCIVVRPEQVEKEPVRAFVNVTDNARSYRSLDVVLQKTNLREQMLGQALKDLRAFEQKYSTLSELADVFNAIHQFQETAT
ncbi:MAG: hypothetical protein LIO94_13695 [Clostridiales bacterium]|nr:hypothetical protein [Clostridiales bacterium]